MRRVPDSLTIDRPINILITNLPIMLCDLLKRAFESAPDMQVIESNHDSLEVGDFAKDGHVDIILFGSWSEENLFSSVMSLEALLNRYTHAKAIVLTQKPDYRTVISLFRAGARGMFCGGDIHFDLLCKSVRCVFEGQIWANNELLGYLVASLSCPNTRDVTDACGKRLLTKREQQVLHLLANGLSNHDLSTTLNLSEHTVKNHLFRIYDKLGVSNRMEAVLYALTPRNTQPISGPSWELSHNRVRLFKTG